MSRYDDVSHLLAELDMERRYKDKIEIENNDLEKGIAELESYLRHLDEVATSGSAEDNEWKTRYEAEKAAEHHLNDLKGWLEAELGEMEWRFHSGSYPEAMNFNLDLLTEHELVRLVKHMERVKADYYNQVRDTEYKAERETKEFHHYDDMRRCFKADLRHATMSVERMKMEEILDRQERRTGTPPMFSPAYVRWLDAQSLDESGALGYKSSKSKRRSKSLTKESTKRSSSKSPGRSKSRSDKSRSKNKDDTDETNGEQDEGNEGGEKSGDDKEEK